MKIALVRRGFSATGGAEAYLLRLAGGLAARGREIALVTSGDWPERAWPYGEIHRLNGSTPSAFAAGFAQLAASFDVTLSLDRTPGCDVFRAGDGVHAAWLKRRAAYEPVWRAFFRRWNPKHGALLMLEREVFASCRHLIANSRLVAEEIQAWHGVPSDQIHVIPNGLAAPLPATDRATARQQLGIPERVFCALFVGTGWERKGLPTALAAVEALEPDALLLVAGRGPATRHASRRARFVGPTTDLSGLFAAADAFVLPTWYDPFSNACLEALAAGLPVVTTTANGFSEILDEATGSVVEPGNSAALTTALEHWAARGRETAEEACRKLAALYSLDRNVDATLRVLEKAAAERE